MQHKPPSSTSELVEQCHHLSGSGAAQRVTQGDGSAVRIHLLRRDPQLLHTVHRLSSPTSQPAGRLLVQPPPQNLNNPTTRLPSGPSTDQIPVKTVLTEVPGLGSVLRMSQIKVQPPSVVLGSRSNSMLPPLSRIYRICLWLI